MMNSEMCELLDKALKGNVMAFKDHLIKCLDLYPDDSDVLLREVNDLFDGYQEAKKLLKQPNESEMQQSNPDPWNDNRFLCFGANHFRKFGKPRGGADYFGLSFAKDEQAVQSLFLLGDNGSGKSSLFDAMEYACTGKIGEAEYRKVNDLAWYYHHDSENEPNIKLVTPKETYDLNQNSFQAKSICDVSPFFISENSIYKLSAYMVNMPGSETMDWTPFFCYMIGLENVLAFLDGRYRGKETDGSLYEELVGKLSDIRELQTTNLDEERKKIIDFVNNTTVQLSDDDKNQLVEFRNLLNDVLSHWSSKDITDDLELIHTHFPRSIGGIYSLTRFKNFIDKAWHAIHVKKDSQTPFPSSLNVVDSDSVYRKILEMIKSLELILQYSENSNGIPFGKIKNELDKYLRLERFGNFSEKNPLDFDLSDFKKELDDFHDSLLKLLPEVLKQNLDDNFKKVVVETLEGNFLDKKEKLAFEFMTKGSICPGFGIKIAVNNIPVNKYFNTFRFRLFCLCLLSAFNFKTMQTYRMLFPFVFDDIFYANDYKNKTQLVRFFEVLADSAENFLDSKDNLQVIFLTHDEQFISTLFRKGLPLKNVRLARLMDCNHVASYFVDEHKEEDAIKYYPLCKDFKRKIKNGY